jgi:hypothetical protein
MSIGTYGEPDAISNAVNYARFYGRSHEAVIRVYDEAGNVIETHEQAGGRAGRDKFMYRPEFTRMLGRATLGTTTENMKDFRTWVKSWNIQSD